jgi:hypothetical protein
LRDFICKACARDPDKRFRNIVEVLAFMKSLADEYGLMNGGPFEPKRKMQVFHLIYGDEDTKKLKAAMDEFSTKITG